MMSGVGYSKVSDYSAIHGQQNMLPGQQNMLPGQQNMLPGQMMAQSLQGQLAAQPHA